MQGRKWLGRCRWLVAIVLALVFAPRSFSQFLEFEKPTGPPALDEFTRSGELIASLETEIAGFIARERAADPVEHVAIRASVNCRIIAADLLNAGDRAGAAGSVSVLFGVTLADGRGAIDESLVKLQTLARRIEQSRGDVNAGVQQRFTVALSLVKRFNELAVEHADAVKAVEAARLLQVLPTVLTPLADAIALLDQTEVRSHWVPAALVNMNRSGTRQVVPNNRPVGVQPAKALDELERRVEAVQVRDDVRRELLLIIDFLRRGAAFPELRQRVALYRAHIAEVLDLAEALAAAPWLDATTRDTYADRIKMGVLLFKDPRTRDRGQRYLDRLQASRTIIDRITALRAMRHPFKPELQPLIDAFLAADAMIENAARAEQGRQQLVRLTNVLDRMIAYRELADLDLRRELRIVHRQLQDAYEKAERTLLDEIDTLSGDPDALADPAFASLMNDQRQYLEDLLRVRRVPNWLDQMTLIAPRSSGPFFAQARKMTAWLLDSNRRPDAILAMEQFEQQLSLFYPLPFEQELAAGTPAAIAATGGMHEPLLRHINEQRQQWAAAWGDGDAASPAAQRLLLLYRLLLTMADTTEVLRLQGDATLLNSWAGWQTSPQVIARAISDLPTRLKLATNAAIEGNDVELAGNLDRIDDDMPLAKLMGRLTAMLADALLELPGGAASTCGQIIHGPTADTWFDERLPKLADICRYALEQEHARATGRDALAAQLRRFVNDACTDLLAVLGDQRDPIPSLIGFDGSDPIPNAQTPGMRRR